MSCVSPSAKQILKRRTRIVSEVLEGKVSAVRFVMKALPLILTRVIVIRFRKRLNTAFCITLTIDALSVKKATWLMLSRAVLVLLLPLRIITVLFSIPTDAITVEITLMLSAMWL